MANSRVAADDFLQQTISRANRFWPKLEVTGYTEDRLSASASIQGHEGKYALSSTPINLAITPDNEGIEMHIHQGSMDLLAPLLKAAKELASHSAVRLAIKPSTTTFDAYWLVATDPTCTYDERRGRWTVGGPTEKQTSLSLVEIMRLINPSKTVLHTLRPDGEGWSVSMDDVAGKINTEGYISVHERIGGVLRTGVEGMLYINPLKKKASFTAADIHSRHFLAEKYDAGLERLNTELNR